MRSADQLAVVDETLATLSQSTYDVGYTVEVTKQALRKTTTAVDAGLGTREALRARYGPPPGEGKPPPTAASPKS